MHTSHRVALKTTTLAASLLAALNLAGLSPAQAQFGSNLIVNGNAEAGPSSPSGNDVEPVPGFTTTGNFTVGQFGPAGSFFTTTDPDGGSNLFEGGPNNASSSAAQLISLLPEAAVIDAGNATFTLSAFLGGYDGQDDNAVLSASFLGAGSNVLGAAQIGPVLSSDRNGMTTLLFRSTNGVVPTGTRSVNVNLQMTRLAGSYNDGYADDLSLVLSQPPAVPEASTTVSFGLLLALGLGGLVVAAKRKKKA